MSSSDELNKIWYDSAYTAQIDSVPAGSLPGNWTIANGVMDADGGDVGLLSQGSSWTDYTDTFDTRIVSGQAGWVVRGQDPNDGYVFILNASNDTAGTPNTLQELDLSDGGYVSVGSVALPASLAPGTWHTVSTTVSGTSHHGLAGRAADLQPELVVVPLRRGRVPGRDRGLPRILR